MSELIKIAYLEDDPIQGAAVEKWLNAQSIKCHLYENAEAMKVALDVIFFDAIILDVQINGEDTGLEVLQYIRDTGGESPAILMVSAEAYWHQALSSGANDFLEKPLSPKKLLVHLRQLMRPVAQPETIENYPPYQLNAQQNQITMNGDLVELSNNEFELASALFRNFGKVLSYGQLMKSISGRPNDEPSRLIESDLLKLKRKMNLRDLDGWMLEPVYRHGYRLVNAQYESELV